MCLSQGCSDKALNSNINEFQEGSKNGVNLFPEERTVYNNTTKLSLEEAFKYSKEVLHVAHIEKVDSSQGRGAKQFYIYKAIDGRFEKSANKKKNKFPILFLSEQKLFKENTFTDSVYLFLEPIRHYVFLKKDLGIKYKWVNVAPFVNFKEK